MKSVDELEMQSSLKPMMQTRFKSFENDFLKHIPRSAIKEKNNCAFRPLWSWSDALFAYTLMRAWQCTNFDYQGRGSRSTYFPDSCRM